ncbi:hypothetical protein BVG16_00340 [Paenibacillus selenitireducens]|uniref:Radical SAM core domain-containing protein n=1 Tax=Paenibacillus selenitireducens TaxID=1324314 RepID=A0A1T2XLU5_9BACL|nr:radical SAM protein [Paenibacillus selenitireducens]OPA80839.1 hypothetical protein BVG16_00340 [Paenibacillus selenitireducens]
MMVHVFVTNDCNLSCDYCYVSELREKLYFRTEFIDSLISFINRALSLNKSEKVLLNFFGGEPLLNKRVIEEIILASNKINVKTNFMMTTNGTLLTKSIIDYLAEHNFILSVSLDGTPEVHNRHRTYANGEPSWEKIKPNLEYLLKKIPGSTARITYNSDNVSELYQSILFLADQGFQEIKPIPNFLDEGWEDEHFSILREQFDKIASFSEKNKNIGLSMLKKKLRIQGDCSGGFDSFSINANGDIYPCTYVVGEEKFRLGNINSADNYELQKFPTDHKQRTDCQGCSYFESCTSSRCIFVNYKMTGELCKPSGFFCAYERMESSYALR